MTEMELIEFIMDPRFFAGGTTALAFEEVIRAAYRKRIQSVTGSNENQEEQEEQVQ